MYIDRNENNEITALYARPQRHGQEFLEVAELHKPVVDGMLAIEQEITPRRLREAILSDEGKAWLLGKDNQIKALRSKKAAK